MHAFVIFVAFAATTMADQAQPPAGNVENGRRLFARYGCYQCHGREGQGSPTTGSRLGPAPWPLPQFVQYVRQPRGEMPPYTMKVLSDAELADIHAFLSARPRPPAAARQP